MLRMANTNKVPDINLEIHRTSRSNSGENEGTYTQYHIIRTTVIFLVLAVLIFGQILSTIGP